MHKRRRLSQTDRKYVYEKTHGRCAYCGQLLQLEDMQIDHVFPLRKGGADAVDNMLPACRSCNYYKDTLTVEQFRRRIQAIPDVLMRDSTAFKNGVRFGVVEATEKPVVFYFEQI